MTYLRVKDNEHLIRDSNSNAIINTDITEYENYVDRYKKIKKDQEEKEQNKEELCHMKHQMEELQKNVNELKSILHSILSNFQR